MEEEKKAAAGVDWAENAPAAPRRRSRKKSAAKGKPKIQAKYHMSLPFSYSIFIAASACFSSTFI